MPKTLDGHCQSPRERQKEHPQTVENELGKHPNTLTTLGRVKLSGPPQRLLSLGAQTESMSHALSASLVPVV